ncbi:uncharacterized protein LOC110836822 isoform X3 [Zootermopsis nevadensis]|nr:uncharacterized protein LOC110836822 isoform X3 [Zootermopsis nevadensis]XP_021934140.1 uncharacterized protein LOC110836822 isoform X3 [Zootermopsis nevadensis]XP_021934141.1 uncharacterized protein LOC110836822 isoform X3 [Zootermopsis nevadensis]XP_021934142.1 uncharacterized protein LOC110836822 isoform X3 [Zootermopsis nevadensis]XP_021934143.1 uncharacterized protein LOC110836822 isoform X3 [Zootermopsis nevadensis]
MSSKQLVMPCAQDLECEDLTAPEEHFAENDLSFLSPASTCGNESEVLKWKFTTPREEFVDLLKDQMTDTNVNRTLLANMFDSDFQFHLKAIDALSEYRALRSVTWRHIYSPYSVSGHLACFYAGSLLDEFLSFLRLGRDSPTDLGLAMLNPDNENKVSKLFYQCLLFMDHFKKITKKFKLDCSTSGAKLIDLCHRMTKKQVGTTPHKQAVTVNGTECHVKAHNRTPYTWFNRLPSSHAQPNQWSEEPSSIYLRMSQPINGRNHFFLEKIHHEKELLIRKDPSALILKYVVPSLYNEFHKNYGYLFFYGILDLSEGDFNFNEERSPTIQLFNYFNLDSFTSHNETDSSDRVINVPESPNMDLNIDIEHQSPLRLAPIKFSDNSLAYISDSDVIVIGYRRIRFR